MPPRKTNDFDAGEFGGSEVLNVEFWKPAKGSEGEAIFGTVESFKTGRIGKDETHSVTLAPAVVVKADGSAEGYGSMRVGLNAVLQSRITSQMKGRHFAIKFTGFEKTQAGDMRVYTVFELNDDGMKAACKKYAPKLLDDEMPF